MHTDRGNNYHSWVITISDKLWRLLFNLISVPGVGYAVKYARWVYLPRLMHKTFPDCYLVLNRTVFHVVSVKRSVILERLLLSLDIRFRKHGTGLVLLHQVSVYI